MLLLIGLIGFAIYPYYKFYVIISRDIPCDYLIFLFDLVSSRIAILLINLEFSCSKLAIFYFNCLIIVSCYYLLLSTKVAI